MKLKIIFLTIALFALAGFIVSIILKTVELQKEHTESSGTEQVEHSIKEETDSSNLSSNSNLEGACISNKGKWISKYSECEGISKNICEENQGFFNECESVCRHDNDPNKPCILLCIPVCKRAK